MKPPIIVGYHAVAEAWDVPLSVGPARMERQVRLLLRLGYRPALLSDAMFAPQAEKTFVVTFDDAYASVIERAAPLLERLGVPATLFVPTDWVGGEARWADMAQWERPGAESELALMEWDAIRALAARGWEIGSHGASHPYLTKLDDATLARELTGSRAVIEAELERPCTTIAYPYGDVDERVVAAAGRAGYRVGTGDWGWRGEQPVPAPLRWPRIGVHPQDTTPRLVAKLLTAARVGAGARAFAAPASAAPPVAPVAPGTAPEARVAVIIPCYNDGVLAHEAVASIREDEPVEVVVVDDRSTQPETAIALDELRARGVTVVAKEVNQGLSAARRTGLAATTAPLIFPLDSDDVLEPGALGRLADCLERRPDAAAAYGDVHEFGTRERHLSMPVRLDPYRVAFRNDYPVCALFRRDALDAVGAWRGVADMVGYEDWDLWMTLAERGDPAVHAGPGFVAVRRRLHGPRMLGDSAGIHRRLYAELKRTHPRLFASVSEHRRTSTLGPVGRLGYPLLFGARPPLGLRVTWWELVGRLKRAR